MSDKDALDLDFELRHWNPKARPYQKILCAAVVGYSRFVMTKLNHLEFIERQNWDSAFQTTKRGILSFSNHVSLFDDPLLVSNLGRVKFSDVRWIGADHKNFYGSALKGFISAAGKCVPIVRGAGLDQPGLTFLSERLKLGDWVHIFPEGGRTRDEHARMKTPFKLGIGQLILDAKPMLAPFYHYGMHELLPIGTTVPKRGQQVRVLFGEPIAVDEAWLGKLDVNAESPTVRDFQTVAQWSFECLRRLELIMHPDP
ncbi:MAG: lysophospholipid acyltransferase family protein [Myxococcota bacterium]|nr:lysophospholipid acyltransferase family protein [Myxococcota bacterium]